MPRCCICHFEISEDEIPEEAKNKIGMKFYWHKKCAEEQEID